MRIAMAAGIGICLLAGCSVPPWAGSTVPAPTTGGTTPRVTNVQRESKPSAPEASMSNPISHFELMVRDPAKAKAFYGRVFSWRFDDQGRSGYTTVDTGQDPRGGLMQVPPGAPGPALNVYFRVASIDQTLRQVVEAGGTVVVPRTEIPTIGWFAMFLDPDRIAIGVLELRR